MSIHKWMNEGLQRASHPGSVALVCMLWQFSEVPCFRFLGILRLVWWLCCSQGLGSYLKWAEFKAIVCLWWHWSLKTYSAGGKWRGWADNVFMHASVIIINWHVFFHTLHATGHHHHFSNSQTSAPDHLLHHSYMYDIRLGWHLSQLRPTIIQAHSRYWSSQKISISMGL